MGANQLSKRQIEQLEEIKKLQQQDLSDVLTNNLFPAELIPGGFHEWMEAALRHEKTNTLQSQWPMLRELMLLNNKRSNEFTFQQMGFACNSIEDKTRHQLEVSDIQYIAIQDSIQEIGIKWKELIEQMNAPIIEKYGKMIGRITTNKPLIIPNTEIIS